MDYWCFPFMKQTNKQENADSIKKKSEHNERVAYIPACS